MPRVQYDPFARGPHRVVLTGGTLIDGARHDRRLDYDLRVPAPMADASGRMDEVPLVLYSHTSFGHRRQATFLFDHLASHGYAVAALDHGGNAAGDLEARLAGAATRTDAERDAYIAQIIADRVPDLRILADAVLAGTTGHALDAHRLGVIGWSFGGWAALAAPEADDRFVSVVAMAAAGSSNPLPGIIPATLTFAYRRDVRVLYLAGDADVATPLDGIAELAGRTPAPARLFVLTGAGHDHFGDAAQDAPPPLDQAQAFTRGLALAHLDATLRGVAAAEAFIEHRALDALADLGVSAKQLA
jgi:dienelactone hydrolase